MNGTLQVRATGTSSPYSVEHEHLNGKEGALYYRSSMFSNNTQSTLAVDFVETSDRPFIKNDSFGEEQVVDLPAVRIPYNEQEGFTLTFQKWRGVVKEISTEIFIAQLSDLTNDCPDEQAELLCADVRPDDRELFSIGSVFYWSVGYMLTASGQQIRYSSFRFQRLPLYDQRTSQIATEKARNLRDTITWL